MVTAATREAILFWAKAQANAQSIALLTFLENAIVAAGSNVGTGGQIISTSGNGRSVTFAIPNAAQGMTQDEYRDLLMALYKCCESAIETLDIASPTAANNAAIFAQMRLDVLFAPVQTYRPDFSEVCA